MRHQCLTLSVLALLTLAACGAPQSAAPTGQQGPSRDTPATVAPAPTGATDTAPTEAQTIAPPLPTATPEGSPMPQSMTSATVQLPTTTQPPAHTARPTPAVDRVPTAQATPAVVGEVPQDLLNKIVTDAARLSGVDAALIVVQVGEAVEWPDGSLGCPKPGIAYIQILVAGYHVVLQASTTSYDYRADNNGRFFICTK